MPAPSRRTLLAALAAGAAPTTRASAGERDAAAQPWAGGRLLRVDAFPSARVPPRTVAIWTPRGYPAPGVRYAALYAQDGQNLFSPADAYLGQTWEMAQHLQALIDSGRAAPTVVVGVWNATVRRGREYAPSAGQAAADRVLLAEEWGGPLYADAYVGFLTDELRPWVEARFAVDPRRSMLIGSSLGGAISLYTLLRRPEIWRAAACLSTHWPLRRPDLLDVDPAATARIGDAFTDWAAAHLPSPRSRGLYFDHGTTTLDAAYPRFQARMDAALARKGWRTGAAESLVFEGAAHDERSWRARLDRPLGFLLG